MNKIISIISLFLLAACMQLQNSNPYVEDLKDLSVVIELSDDLQSLKTEGISVTLSELNNGTEFKQHFDDKGVAVFRLPAGVYRATISESIAGEQFNASVSGIVLSENKTISIPLVLSKTGDLLIKEVYCGGCSKAPQEGNYAYDSYIIIHNNSAKVQYLDSLCFGAVAPYNSTSAPVWEADIDFAPIIQALWMFPGSGQDHPLQPGGDAVLVLKEAIDHRSTYPLSVNLNMSDYYVLYNSTLFPGSSSHPVPVPGDKISPDHILDLVRKMGQANTYTFSISSPAMVIFKTKDMNVQEFLDSEGVIVQLPGSTVDRVVKVPLDWIIDGMEVFAGQSNSNKKRLGASVDASSITLSNIYEGKSLVRRVNEERSAAAGYEVLYDTNNSSSDFIEIPEASLRKN